MLRRVMMSGGTGGGSVDPTAAAILAKLTSWWEMSETSGVRNDSKGANHLAVNGTGVGAATGVRGSGDVAASFVPNNTLVVSSNASLLVPTGGGDHCMFGWVYLNGNTGVQCFYGKTGGSADRLEYAGSMQGGVYYGQNGGSAYYNASQSAPAAGVWHFFIQWRDATDGMVRMQIDNGPVNVSSSASNPSPGSNDLVFGANGNSGVGYLSGRLQRWGWIRGAILATDERTWLFNSGAGRTYAEMMAAAGM